MTLRPWIPALLTLTFASGMAWLLHGMQYKEATVLAAVPFLLGMVYLFLYFPEKFILGMVFFIPLSVNVEDIAVGAAMSLPFEPLLLLAALLFWLQMIQKGKGTQNWWRHPVTLAIGLQLAWLLVTTMNSTYQLISTKMVVARLIYLLVFYGLFVQLFQQGNWGLRYLWHYLLGALPMVVYALVRLGSMGLARRYSPVMADPFYDDHTVFGACLAMLLPVVVVIWTQRKTWLAEVRGRKWIHVVALAVVLGVTFSFSRAAWMSIIFVAGMYLVFRWRVRFSALLVVFLSVLVVAGLNADSIWENMRRNDNVSGEDLVMTAKSVTNVSSDESNMERVNRWSCAYRMWQDKPWLGFGPGTYERNYGGYQLKAEKTRISSKDGDRGDAHSEYLTALSEQGLPGLVIWLLLLGTILYTGMRVIYHSPLPNDRLLALGVTLGLLTYYLHGMVNSFLDLDKAAPLFWGMAALLVALDLRARQASHLSALPNQLNA